MQAIASPKYCQNLFNFRVSPVVQSVHYFMQSSKSTVIDSIFFTLSMGMENILLIYGTAKLKKA